MAHNIQENDAQEGLSDDEVTDKWTDGRTDET